MTPHAPKLFALEALVADQLSGPGRARIERHLSRCEACRAALGAVREYARVRDSARELPMPELAWEQMERALDRDLLNVAERKHASPPHAGRNGKLLALALPILAIAATVVIGWVGISGQREAAQLAARTQTKQAQPVTPVEGAATGWVTLGRLETHASGSPVIEGATLRTGRDEELHVHLGTGTGIVLAPDSELLIVRLTEHTVRLSLVRGGVSSTVRKLAAADSYVIEAAGYSAEVRGTRFFVGRAADDVHVAVHEGKVAILRQGKQIDLLTAGKSFSTTVPVGLKTSVDRLVLGLDDASHSWPTLTLPPLPQVSAWQVGDARLLAQAELSMRVPAGDLTLSFEDARGRLHAFQVTVAAEGSRIEEATIRAALQAEADARTGTLAPELIKPVIQGALPGLRRCYERGLRRARVEGRLTLAVRVAADGHVARAQLRGESALPVELTECIANQARGWVFPAPDGGPVAFEIPLNLKAASSSP